MSMKKGGSNTVGGNGPRGVRLRQRGQSENIEREGVRVERSKIRERMEGG